jgi:ATP-dependent RNA helicase DeaD
MAGPKGSRVIETTRGWPTAAGMFAATHPEAWIRNADGTPLIRTFAGGLPWVKLAVLYGGARYDRQLKELRDSPQIVVATPGRLSDHQRRGTVNLDRVRMVVLDEADEMLAMGFRDDVEAILGQTSGKRQTLLFSATMPPIIRDLAQRFLR